MKASELIAALQQEIQTNGDKQLIFAANKHSYYSAKVVNTDGNTTLALYDKVPE